MELNAIFNAVGTLGLPVVVTIVLVWHFLHVNKSLSEHNQRLVNELASLRAELAKIHQTDVHSERLLQQSESLRTLIESRDRESQVLLRLLVEAQINHPRAGLMVTEEV